MPEIMALIEMLLRSATINVVVWGAVLVLCAIARHLAS